MKNDNCIFCKILSNELPSNMIYQDELVSAFMDIQPVNPGHVLVIPNVHSPYLTDLETETGAQMFRIGQKLAAALRKSDIKCEGINLFLADGEAAMQEVFHSHLHIIPRFKGDGFGLTFSEECAILPERTELEKIADNIKSLI